jgi:hypothetical protein
MKSPPDQPVPAPQGGARHSVRADGWPKENGAQETDAPYPTNLDELTGLPGFGTWRGVYVFVFGSFILWVALLFVLTRIFS